MPNCGLPGIAKAGAVACIAVLAACGGGNSAGSYSVGGTVTGLASGSSVVLQLNGAGTTTISANGSFTVSLPLANDVDYSVTVLTQPADQVCNLDSASGTSHGADITGVTLSCYATFQRYSPFIDGGRRGLPRAGPAHHA